MTEAAPARRRLGVTAVAALLVTAAVTGVGYAVASGLEDPEAAVLGPGDVTIEIDIEYSRFLPDRLTVAEGTRVRFLVVNGDPIHHELITGGPDVHIRHAKGTEADHPSVPGEVSVEPNGTAITTFSFDEPGVYEFACHLPGHYEYGMRGEIEVVPKSG
jgi:uncharacterized cupredoxin-like copper-binding protein